MVKLNCDIFIEKKETFISNILIKNLSNNDNDFKYSIKKIKI